jgi:hypothetical protein
MPQCGTGFQPVCLTHGQSAQESTDGIGRPCYEFCHLQFASWSQAVVPAVSVALALETFAAASNALM